jgi:hypothetical protein
MVFEYEGYKLIKGKISLKDGKTYERYFFAKRDLKGDESYAKELPKDYKVVPPKRKGGFPYLTKK